MSRRKAERVAGRTNLSRIQVTAIGALALCAVSMLPAIAHATSDGLVLWNKLGSEAEVLNSAYGPNLSFFNTPGEPDIVGNPDYLPAVFGNGVSIGPGSYQSGSREHTVVWSGVDQYLNPDRGTVSVWYKQNADPIGYDHGVYRLFNGAYGLDSGIGLWSQAWDPAPGPALLYFGLSFGSTPTEVAYNISSHNGEWIHVAGVWDRDGIDNSPEKLRLYIDGIEVASNTFASWGTTVGQMIDIAGGNDQNIAGQFAVDNLKVYNVAVTDFSDRFVEGVPEPGSACLAIVAMVFFGALRTKRR